MLARGTSRHPWVKKVVRECLFPWQQLRARLREHVRTCETDRGSGPSPRCFRTNPKHNYGPACRSFQAVMASQKEHKLFISYEAYCLQRWGGGDLEDFPIFPLKLNVLNKMFLSMF